MFWGYGVQGAVAFVALVLTKLILLLTLTYYSSNRCVDRIACLFLFVF